MPPEQPVFCDDADPVLFSRRVHPVRSLPLKGFVLLIGVVLAINLIGALRFAAIGAWPVLPFLGLDVLALVYAFHLNYRGARAYEEISVTPYAVQVRQVDAKGRARHWRADTLFTRLVVAKDIEGEITALSLASRGQEVPVGLHLPLPDRASFAASLTAALRQGRG